jgi:N-acetylglucosaminyl-diphospho-decaprenol L-rhamnosyltransferase
LNHSIRLCVVIINYATPDLTKACLASLNGELGPQDCAVVVDNCSPDNSGPGLKLWLTEQNFSFQTDFILSKENHGFSGGNNLGIQHVKADYYLLLNSDTYVRNGAISQLIKTAQTTDRNIGLITPRLEWPDAQPQISCFRFHSPIGELLNASGLNFFVNIFQRYHIPMPLKSETSSPPWSSFACILIKYSVIEAAGLMDENYFLYYEDVDYCRIANKKGFFVLNDPNARVVHLRGGSSNVKKETISKKRLPTYYYASRTYYFFKHYGLSGLILANLLWTIGGIIDVLKSFILNRSNFKCEKQFTDIWINTLNPNVKYRPKK